MFIIFSRRREFSKFRAFRILGGRHHMGSKGAWDMTIEAKARRNKWGRSQRSLDFVFLLPFFSFDLERSFLYVD
jgi:hypothetical protein